jgi:hypothetical protein
LVHIIIFIYLNKSNILFIQSSSASTLVMSKEAYVPPTTGGTSPVGSSAPTGGLSSFGTVAPRAPVTISYLCAGNFAPSKESE